MIYKIPAIRPFDLHQDEIDRLEKGDIFITLLRSEQNELISPAYVGDTLWGRDMFARSKYALRVISVVINAEKWVIVVKRLHIQQPTYTAVKHKEFENSVSTSR